MKGATKTVYTVGHSTRSVGELIAPLRQAGVDTLVDIRSVPRSRTNPQFNGDTLPATLAAAGIGYVHNKALGGLRHRRKDAPASHHTLWRNEAFRNYAEYAETDMFRAGLDALSALAQDHCCAIMCAEAVWWRCHRRIVADYLLTRGFAVQHIMGPGKIEPAVLTAGAQPRPEGTIVYCGDAPSGLPLFKA